MSTIVMMFFLYLLSYSFPQYTKNLNSDNNNSYKGTIWHTDRTIKVVNAAQTPYARCDVHHVVSEDGNNIVKDWIFLEEMDAINVAVLTEEGKFIVFQQNKYAIPGETFTPVGGFIDTGEAPWEAARREVKEELGLGSRRTLQNMEAYGYDVSTANIQAANTIFESLTKITREVDSHNENDLKSNLAKGIVPEGEMVSWVFLGRYRTAANRGGGFLYSYLLKDAVPILPKGGTMDFVSSGDDEKQKIVYMSINEISENLLNGKFQEVKWTATIANSLLHLNANK